MSAPAAAGGTTGTTGTTGATDTGGPVVTADLSTGDAVLAGFGAEVGPSGPVSAVGGMTQWDVGGLPADGVRMVKAPSGVVDHRPAEMLVRVRAGTTVAELDEVLAGAGQMVPLDPDDPARATVGGVLAVGRAGPRRLRHGPVRDHVLEVHYVSAGGEMVRAGAPVVKNVSGFDLVRLMVGSLGTLGLLAEVVLRTYPRPRAARWLTANAFGAAPPPAAGPPGVHRPSSLLWDGAAAWILLEGHPADVDTQCRALGPAWSECDGPPPRPGPGRLSVPPGRLGPETARREPGSFLAEVGVGIVHTDRSEPVPPVDPGVAELNRRIKARFDPEGRFNPGRSVLAPA